LIAAEVRHGIGHVSTKPDYGNMEMKLRNVSLVKVDEVVERIKGIIG